MEVQDKTKVRLIEAAGEEFAEKGLDGARVQRICERARANLAAVNYHFGNKKQLYVQVVRTAQRYGLMVEAEGQSECSSPSEELRGFIRHFLRGALAINDPDDWRHRLLLRELLHSTAAPEVLVREAIRPRFERLTQALERLEPAADARKVHAMAFSIIGQCLYYKMARAVNERLIGAKALERLDLDYLTDHITSVCLSAMGAAASSPGPS